MTAIILTSLTFAAPALCARPSMSVRISNQIVQTWTCQTQLGVDRTEARPSPWELGRHSAGFRAALLNRWTLRRQACVAALHEIARQWNWQAWLPDKWRRIGVCETGLNWQHYNSGYQGAFGFATQSWDQFKLDGYPEDANQASPWQQYQVALAIWRRFGFSGWGCRNA